MLHGKRYLGVMIGFSTFAKLRPQWSILAGAPGMHSVCACVYHQNLKSMAGIFFVMFSK